MKKLKPSRRELRREALREETVRRNSQHARREFETANIIKPIIPKNEFQRELHTSMMEAQVVFVDAPAGCGKTFVLMSQAADWLKQNKIQKIVLSRPSVGMGKSLGLLPGTLKEKFEPYLMPLVDVIKGRYGHGFYECQMGLGNIEFVPLEYVRGRSFENAVVIVDESQNTKPDEMYSIMTRLGENSKLFCIGDSEQNDMGGENGLDWAIDFINRHALGDYAAVVEGTSDDIVRSGFCKAVVKAMELDNEGGE